jgi:NADH-ubiquinone oxidoreductase chain 4L
MLLLGLHIDFLTFFSNLIFVCMFIFFWGLTLITIARKNLIIVILGLELTLLGLGFMFIVYAILSYNFLGSIIVFVLLTLGGAESALGLCLVMIYFSLKESVDLSSINGLKY